MATCGRRGGRRATHEAVVAIIVEGVDGEYHAPVFTGDGADVPGRWGLRSQQAMHALIDTGGNAVIMPGPGGFEINLSPGSRVIRYEDAVSGHMMVPVSDFEGKAMQSKTASFRVRPCRLREYPSKYSNAV